MAKLQLATDRSVLSSLLVAVFLWRFAPFFDSFVSRRSAAGVLVSDSKGRDIKIDQYTLSFHGRLLIEGAEISLNYGQRYGLLGENGSGKVCTQPIICARWCSPALAVHAPPVHR